MGACCKMVREHAADDGACKQRDADAADSQRHTQGERSKHLVADSKLSTVGCIWQCKQCAGSQMPANSHWQTAWGCACTRVGRLRHITLAQQMQAGTLKLQVLASAQKAAPQHVWKDFSQG